MRLITYERKEENNLIYYVLFKFKSFSFLFVVCVDGVVLCGGKERKRKRVEKEKRMKR